MGKSYKKITEPKKFKKTRPRNTSIKPQNNSSNRIRECNSAQDWYEGEWEESFERFDKKK